MLGLVALNLGGPASLDEVEPFLARLFADPAVIQLGWAKFLQKPLARLIARRRAPESRKAYAQIGGGSPILAESSAQAAAVVAALAARGIAATPAVAMAAWHPLADEVMTELAQKGITRAVAVSLFPHWSHTTTGAALRDLRAAAAKSGVEVAAIERYPLAPGYLAALVARITDAIATLPRELQDVAPVLLSAHGLPESYIRKGDPYLDDVRTTVAAVSNQLGLGSRAQLCFQSRLGPQKWLGPTTEETLERLGDAGNRAVVVCPVAFTGEHIETLQEIDIVYRQLAHSRGIKHFARARTVGLHPAFVEALAELAAKVARERGWA